MEFAPSTSFAGVQGALTRRVFFTALTEYSKQPTRRFHANARISAGKSIFRGLTGSKDMGAFYGPTSLARPRHQPASR